MSTSGYIKNPTEMYIVEWSYVVQGKRKAFKRPCYAKSDEEALGETRKAVLMSSLDTFEMKVVGKKVI